MSEQAKEENRIMRYILKEISPMARRLCFCI